MRAGIRAATRLTVERAAGRQALRWAHDWPVVLRPTGTGDEHVHLVHAAGGPLGGDDLALSVEVGPQARLTVRSAGATLVQPGAATDAPARWTVELDVGDACYSPVRNHDRACGGPTTAEPGRSDN